MNNIGEKYLPIGTVCILKKAKKRVMIIGFAAKGKETKDKIFDYIGCLYPEGVISSDKNLLFNHDQIDKIFYMGYVDNESKDLMEKLKSYLNENNDSNSNISQQVGNINITQPSSQKVIKSTENISQIQPMPEMQSVLQTQQSVQQPTQQQSNINRDDIFNSIPNQE